MAQDSKINLKIPSAPRRLPVVMQRGVLQVLKYWPFKNFMRLEFSRALPYWGRMPLIDFKHQRILFYTPKAGCSTAISWFLKGAGLLEEALEYDSWVHSYVNKEYRWKFQLYRQFPKVFGSQNYTHIKVVRNPFTRFISSYFHALKWREWYFPQGLASDFCLQDFLVLLRQHDPFLLNVHFAPQYSLWERMQEGVMNEILQLETLGEDIRKMNQRYGWEHPLDDEVTVLRNATPKTEVSSGDLHRTPYLELIRDFPRDYGLFYTDATFKRSVYDFYRIDFETYGYNFDSI